MLCEGGPHLNAQLLAAGLVDELFLSLGPLLAGGGGPGEALRIIAGADLDPPVRLELLGVLESESQLFLRYAVRSNATTPASLSWRPARSVRIATFSTTPLGTSTDPSSVASVV